MAVLVNDFGSINTDAELVVGVERRDQPRGRLRVLHGPGRPDRVGGRDSAVLLALLELGLTDRAAVEQLLRVHD